MSDGWEDGSGVIAGRGAPSSQRQAFEELRDSVAPGDEMTPVWFRLRTEARSRWRAWAGLALLIGVFSGAVVATAAGARRTDTAYPRFVVAQRAADLLVFNVPSFGHVDFDQLQRLPQVQESSQNEAFST
ncbi:MAG: hypothetical protein M3010_13290, partial [Candidatus Dormibacteraeota bacterium]|nr:hypothetical protein [Candidatus Dormibacteraeota bacterium]